MLFNRFIVTPGCKVWREKRKQKTGHRLTGSLTDHSLAVYWWDLEFALINDLWWWKKSTQARRKEVHAPNTVINGAGAMEMGQTGEDEEEGQQHKWKYHRLLFVEKKEMWVKVSGAGGTLPHPSCVALCTCYFWIVLSTNVIRVYVAKCILIVDTVSCGGDKALIHTWLKDKYH